jgi:hypothetical protein
MGDSRFARCLQGGGVYVNGGTVSIMNSQIYSNTANTYVRADFSLTFEIALIAKPGNLLVVCRAAVSMSMVAQCQS